MTRSMDYRYFLAICGLRGFVGAVALACVSLLHAADTQPQGIPSGVLSGQQIEEALHPPKTRSLTGRGLTRRDAGEQSVSLNIQFEHNSSALQPQASLQLDQLLLALTSPALRQDRFQVAGHTDAKGARHFNKALSLRRAEAVKKFLVAKGIDAQRVDTIGYGSERLLAPERPDDPRNRRVEIRDLGNSSR